MAVPLHQATHQRVAGQELISFPKRVYVTTTGGNWSPLTVALCMALTLRNHGTPEAIRGTARRLVDYVSREKQPNMKRLARDPRINDEAAIKCSLAIINRVCELDGIRTDIEFKHDLPQLDSQNGIRAIP